jgi:hypothetical protein
MISQAKENSNHNVAVDRYKKWFQNLQSGPRSRRGERFNRRNTWSILRIKRLTATPRLGPRGRVKRLLMSDGDAITPFTAGGKPAFRLWHIHDIGNVKK